MEIHEWLKHDDRSTIKFVLEIRWLGIGDAELATYFLLLGTTKNFWPNARDPPRTRLNNTTSQFSLPSTGDPCIIHKNKNGPVESECKLNNVNPHIIRNQYQIQNQIEVTLNEYKYFKLCHYHTKTEF